MELNDNSDRYIDRYYMTEVDRFPESIYCHHAMMGESVIPEHVHDKGQFLYTEGGVVYLNTSTQSFFLPARHYIWIPAGVRHSIHPSTPEVVMRNLYFPMRADDLIFFNRTAIYPVNNLLMELIMFTNRWNGNITPDDVSRYGIAYAFKLLLPELSVGALPLALPYPADNRLKKIVSFLNDHIASNMGVPEIASEFGFSERSLSRLFQKELHMTFIQYATILRMLRALKLLLDERLPVNEVAHAVGYSSLPTFSNTFYKVVGVRPSEYVKLKGVY
ncbi:transcriptional regulator, AraC family [bacterium A37T11]|nr:transcriptional regulator, AraC family [bacterium A37T11]